MLSSEEKKERQKAADRLYYQRNAERIKEAGRCRHANRSPEWRARNRERTREYSRKRRAEKTPEALARKVRGREYTRRWCAEHHEQHLASVRAWKANNPEIARLHLVEKSHKRRARKHNTAIGTIDYRAVSLRTLGCCGICGEQVGPKFHWDHIVPLSKGGPHTTENLQVAHESCNVRKHAKLPEAA